LPAAALLEGIFQDAPEYFVVLDPELRITAAGAAFRRATGVEKEAGTSFLDTIDRFSLSRAREVFEELRLGTEGSRNLVIHHRGTGDETLPVEYSWVSCLDESGRCRAFVGIGREKGKRGGDGGEIEELRKHLETANVQLERRAKEIARLREELKHQSTLDELTQLNNRRFIMERLEAETARAIRYDQPLTLILFDVDHMERVNQEHGSDRGDEVLGSVAQVVKDQVRATDIAARYSGEEFLILCPHTDRPSAQFLAERLRRRVSELSFTGDEAEFGVTISVGLVTVDARNEFDVEAILHAAQQALEAAKLGGMNRVRLVEVT